MKRFLALVLLVSMIAGCIPAVSLAAAKQMNDGVPVWTEENVRQYALDYIEGKSMDRLWGYYDLQIRRYLPQESYEAFLIDLEFLTGDFVGLGSYRNFEEEKYATKTHVLHLCMEKQDLEMYFTHKNKENDWEIMALEFVPAAKELPVDAQILVGDEQEAAYVEEYVAVGQSPYILEGILTVPADSSANAPVPACVLVHDFNAKDRDHTVGKTKLFKDIAELFGEMGIATIRYDKRTYTYSNAVIETVEDEVIADALSAIGILAKDERIDSSRIIVMGLGLGGMMTPRIASESDGAVAGMILLNATTETVLDYLFKRSDLTSMSKDELNKVKNLVRNHKKMKKSTARGYTAFDRNGYYYWESAQYDQCKVARKLALPICVAYSKKDDRISEDDGYQAFRKYLGVNGKFITYMLFRGVNHQLTGDLSVGLSGKHEYTIDSHLDKYAGRTLANWILDIKSK